MAKPIRATPTLKGSEAVSFVENLIREEQKPSKNRIKTIDNALKTNFNICS